MNTYKQHFACLIRNSERRFIDYKQMLGELFKEKKLYQPDDFEWMRLHLRELKNNEERFWKSVVNEWTELKQNYGY
jgi:hypothetical protein